jgi:hypothetical protein
MDLNGDGTVVRALHAKVCSECSCQISDALPQEASEVLKGTRQASEQAAAMMAGMMSAMGGGSESQIKRAMVSQAKAAAEMAAKNFEEEFQSKKV